MIFFFQINCFDKFLQKYNQSVKYFDPDQILRFAVRPDLGQNGLQRLFVKMILVQRVRHEVKLYHKNNHAQRRRRHTVSASLKWASTRENLSSVGLRITQAQTSLRISAVWSAPLLFAFCKVPYVNLLQMKFQFSS